MQAAWRKPEKGAVLCRIRQDPGGDVSIGTRSKKISCQIPSMFCKISPSFSFSFSTLNGLSQIRRDRLFPHWSFDYLRNRDVVTFSIIIDYQIKPRGVAIHQSSPRILPKWCGLDSSHPSSPTCIFSITAIPLLYTMPWPLPPLGLTLLTVSNFPISTDDHPV